MANKDDSMAAVYASKAALRKSMLRTLRGISEADLASQSQEVTRLLFEQPFFTKASTVGCYLNMAKGELRTDGIVKELLASGKALYTPYLPPSASQPGEPTPLMDMLRLYNTQDLESCPLDKWGILDPGTHRRDVENQPREDVMDPSAPPLDVILVPGVAFDAQCNRLGRGKAFYDTFLAKYSAARTRPLLVALALAPQVIDEDVPVTDSDFTLDAVLSPAGLVWREGAKPK